MALAECDPAVGNGEDVPPERVARPERLHRGEVRAPARCRRDCPARPAARLADVTAGRAIAQRATTFHAATGIPAASRAIATAAFVLIERMGVLRQRSCEDLHVIGPARPVESRKPAPISVKSRFEDVRAMTG